MAGILRTQQRCGIDTPDFRRLALFDRRRRLGQLTRFPVKLAVVGVGVIARARRSILRRTQLTFGKLSTVLSSLGIIGGEKNLQVMSSRRYRTICNG